MTVEHQGRQKKIIPYGSLLFLYSFNTLSNFYVQNMFGRSTSKIYGLALLASGQSNTVTTSYSGQYIMQVTYNGWLQGMSVPGIVHREIHLPYIILILILYMEGSAT